MKNIALRALLLVAAAAIIPACLPPKNPPPTAFGKAYGGIQGERAALSPVQDRDNGLYFTGTTYFDFGAGMGDFLIMALKPDGAVEWAKTFGGSSDDYMSASIATNDGGIVAVGTLGNPTPGGNIYVVRVNADGSTAWHETFVDAGTEGAGAVQATADGGFVVAGNLNYGGSTWIAKLAGDGSPVWQYTYGPGSLLGMNAAAGGGQIVSATLGNSIRIYKIGNDGIPVWGKLFTQDGYNFADSVLPTSDGGCLITGQGSLPPNTGVIQYAILAMKLNADGSLAWQRKLSAGQQDEGHGAVEIDGDFLITGGSFNGSRWDAVLLRLHADGSLAAQDRYAGVDYNYFKTIRKNPAGGFWITGETASFGNGVGTTTPDLWFLQTDKTGALPVTASAGGYTSTTPVVTVSDSLPTAGAATLTRTVLSGSGVDAPVIVHSAP